jgi:RecB family exonuclease
MGLIRALTTNRAWTEPDAPDRRLRGREYPVPFTEVWEAALETARRRPRWTVTAAEPRRGEIHAEARTALWRFTDDVTIRVSLDGDGMTRVDAVSQSRVGGADFGVNARRIARFLHALDRRLRRRGGGAQPRKSASGR